jgi:folate-dependent tRNA-U54 methylase TrmFO/GidA
MVRITEVGKMGPGRGCLVKIREGVAAVFEHVAITQGPRTAVDHTDAICDFTDLTALSIFDVIRPVQVLIIIAHRIVVN